MALSSHRATAVIASRAPVEARQALVQCRQLILEQDYIARSMGEEELKLLHAAASAGGLSTGFSLALQIMVSYRSAPAITGHYELSSRLERSNHPIISRSVLIYGHGRRPSEMPEEGHGMFEARRSNGRRRGAALAIRRQLSEVEREMA